LRVRADRSLFFLMPGDLGARTGGYRYDRRVIAGLRERDWAVEVVGLDASFPHPTTLARTEAAARLAELDAGTTVVMDGLALGAIPELVEAHRGRLRIIALVHHPLADESGLSPPQIAALHQSEQAALAAAKQVVVTSAATARRLREMGVDPSKVSVIEPGTDPAPLAPRRGGPPLRLLCVGAVIPRKGHRVLVDALARLPERDWHLTVVGSLERAPKTAARLRAQIAGHGLDTRVMLMGELDEAALEQAYQEADLFVLPSLLEGYGMAFAEALARGLPIVGSGAGAVRETVPADAGVLIEPGSSAALADALAEVIRNRAYRRQLAAGAERARASLPDWPSRIALWSILLTAPYSGGTEVPAGGFCDPGPGEHA
jgi:glycosyltransferase involved in cell wall biosynthesis